MHPVDLWPILEEHERRRRLEAAEQRLVDRSTSRWRRLMRGRPRMGIGSQPLLQPPPDTGEALAAKATRAGR